MRNVVLALVLTTLVILAGTAQTPAASSWNGIEEVQTMSLCLLHGADSVLCVATDGMEYSYQGAAFIKVGGIGATGPAGPPGPVGATGPAGPAGPAGTNGVTSVNGKSGVVILSASIQ